MDWNDYDPKSECPCITCSSDMAYLTDCVRTDDEED